MEFKRFEELAHIPQEGDKPFREEDMLVQPEWFIQLCRRLDRVVESIKE